MNNAFRHTLTFCFALVIFSPLFAQQADTAKTADTSITAQPNIFDGFSTFYMHPIANHFQGSLLQLDASIEYSSNAGVNTLAYDFYLQNPLHPKAINATVNNLSAINIGGRESNTGIKYIIPTKKYNNFFFVNYSARSHQSVRFSDDFGTFFFKGNREFAGDTMIGDDLRYLRTRYDALQFGWMNIFDIKGKRATIAISAGVARRFDYWRLEAKKLRLFTEKDGDYVDVQLGMEAERSKIAIQPFNAAGLGALANIDFNLLVSEKSAIGISIADLGFINWNKNATTYNRGDTSIRFDGVFVPSADSLNSPSYTQRIGDSIITRFNIPYDANSGFTTMLPTRINLTYYMGFTKKNYLNVRLQMIAFSNFRAQLNIESLNFINKHLYSQTGIALGGFGPLDIYQKVGWQINKRYFASLGIYGVEGIIFPSKTAGFGGNIGVAARL